MTILPEDESRNLWTEHQTSLEAPAESQPETAGAEPADAAPLFRSFEPPRPRALAPNMGHLSLLGVILVFGLLCTGILMQIGMHTHFLGVSTTQQAESDIRYTLGSEGILYLFTLAACLFIFPLVWQRSLFAGVQWRGATALRLSRRLAWVAVACFALALLSSLIVPSPGKTPVEKILSTPGAGWLMFFFGVTFAPFFEELFFRGFLLPAFCTCFDWVAGLVSPAARELSQYTMRPFWPRIAVVAALTVTVIPFAAVCVYPTSHFLVRIPLFLAWCLGIGLTWLITNKRARGHAEPVVNLDGNGHPLWSMPAMIFSALYTSAAFALMHAAQTAYAWGPLVLLVGVALVLSAVRLVTRSLAASVLVHSCYNFLLFFVMAVGSRGFHHLDKM